MNPCNTSYIKPVSGCIKDRWSAGRTGGGRVEDEVEHAENQDERENLLRLFCWIVPFSLRSNFHSLKDSACGSQRPLR